MRSISRLSTLTGLLLPLALVFLLVAPATAARKQKKKDRKKPTQTSATTAAAEESAPASGLPAAPAAVRDAQRHLLAYETDAASRALDGMAADDPWVATTRGWLLQQRADFDSAISESRRAATLDQANPAPLIRLGECLNYAAKGGADEAYSGAQQRAEALVAKNPQDVEALVYLGIAQQRRKRFDESAATLDKARALAPEDPMVHFHLGVTRFYQQRWQDAFDLLTTALDENSGIVLGYYYKGLAAGKLERKDVMFNDLDRFVRHAPNAPEADYARQLLAAFG